MTVRPKPEPKPAGRLTRGVSSHFNTRPNTRSHPNEAAGVSARDVNAEEAIGGLSQLSVSKVNGQADISGPSASETGRSSDIHQQLSGQSHGPPTPSSISINHPEATESTAITASSASNHPTRGSRPPAKTRKKVTQPPPQVIGNNDRAPVPRNLTSVVNRNPSTSDEHRYADGYSGPPAHPLEIHTPTAPDTSGTPTITLVIVPSKPTADSTLPITQTKAITPPSQGKDDHQRDQKSVVGSTSATVNEIRRINHQSLVNTPESDRMSGIEIQSPPKSLPNLDPMDIDSPERARDLKNKYEALEGKATEFANFMHQKEKVEEKLKRQREKRKRLKKKIKVLKRENKQWMQLKRTSVDCIRPFIILLKAVSDEFYIDREKDKDYIRWRSLLGH